MRLFMDVAAAVHWLSERDPAVVGPMLFLVAFAEVVIPGVPGDVLALAAAVMVFGFGWPLWPTLLALVVGGLLGGMFNYGVGVWLRRTDRLSWLGRFRPMVDQALVGIERRGPALLAANRFFPGVRGFFFVGAGLASIGWKSVFAWGAVGSAIWYALLFGAGWLVGTNLEALQSLLVAQGWVLGSIALIALVSYCIYLRFSPSEALPEPQAE